MKHDLSESAYNDRREVCENVSEKLNIKTLRDTNKSHLETVKNEISSEAYQKALYVIEENERVQLFSKAIKDDNLAVLGQLLYQSHQGLSTQYNVSCEELDFLVNLAKETPTILGARMMGGGFGGCTINLILKSQAKKFKKEISKSYLKEFNKKCSIYSIKLSKGTRKV